MSDLPLHCADTVHPITMSAIVRQESGGRPFAIGINGGTKLARQPKNKAEAIGWAIWFERNGYNIDAGVAQINIRNKQRYGYSWDMIFDPCENIRLGGHILTQNYLGAKRSIGNDQDALRAALSAYNTGNFKSGFKNGYVMKVVNRARVM